MPFKITPKIAGELVGHEAIVTEAYRDSVDVWTWSVGITNSSGHKVFPRYKDNPQTILRCLEIFEWVLRNKYMPAVDEVFKGRNLTEAQVGAALSFHYNTGGLRRATWVRNVLDGDMAAGRKNIMNWVKAGGKVNQGLVNRRTAERNLFFDGTWSNTTKARVIPVSKPSYKPNFAGGKSVDIGNELDQLFKNP